MIRLACVFFVSVWLAVLCQTHANPVNKRTRTARSDDTYDFVQDALFAHNVYRREHGVPPLMISKILNVRAQKWADQLAVEDSMVHDPDTQYGENLHMFWSSNPNAKPRGEKAVDDWYEEIKNYDFDSPHFSPDTGHFTQVVWKGTSELGIGIAQSQISNRWYTVAKYSPRGNYLGQFAKNVLRPSTVN